jgi:hypothetical protein
MATVVSTHQLGTSGTGGDGDRDDRRDRTAREKVDYWLQAARWPIPEWYKAATRSDRTPSFEAYSTQQLRTRYLELEGDFRSIVDNFTPHDMPTAGLVFNYLQMVRPALEVEHPDLLTVSSTLDLIERFMVWLYPSDVLQTLGNSVILKLETLRPYGWERYAQDLRQPREDMVSARPTLDLAIAACNRVVLANQISSGLQIKRLRAFRKYGFGMLAVLLAVIPLVSKPEALKLWPVDQVMAAAPSWNPLWSPFWNPWLSALTVLIIGMMGGFLSGFLQSRSSRVTLSDYQETMLKLMLRPLVGGMISLILVAFLSWGLIPAIDVTKAGSFFLAAFLAGFSERYFLGLLDLQEPDAPATNGAKPAATSMPTDGSDTNGNAATNADTNANANTQSGNGT